MKRPPIQTADLVPNDFSHIDERTTGISDLILREFRALGCRAVNNDRLITVEMGGRKAMLYDTETSFTSATGKLLLKNKSWTRQVLAEAGLSIPKGRSFPVNQRDMARQYLARMGRGVVKPVDGNMGRAVSVGVTEDTFDAAWDAAARATRRGILIEEAYEGGTEARYLVIGGKCIGVILRLPPSVTGDGVRTIAELIEARNEEKSKIPGRSSKLIEMDDHRHSLLRARGLSMSSVLENGEYLEIDSKASISTGGDSYEVTELARPDLKRIAEKVVTLAPGLDVIGVDILAKDHFDGTAKLDYVIIEANTRPGLSAHLFPDYGHPNETYRSLAEFCVTSMGFDLPTPARPMDIASVSSLPLTEDAPKTGADEITLLFGGDTSLGDSYIARQKNPEIKQRLRDAPEEFFSDLLPLLAGKDHFILNFESVLARSAKDPWGGKKKYLGLDDPERTVATLQAIGVDSVSLANNHTMDFGPSALLETLDRFKEAGIHTFGAGRSVRDSAFPLVLSTEMGNIYIFGGFEYRKRYLDDFKYYTTRNRPGVQGFSRSSESLLMREIRDFRRHDPDSFIIAYPHWGGDQNYTWANEGMMAANTEFLKAGADIVLGHGAHMMQQCWVEDARTTVFSLGNFVFNSSGRFSKAGAAPYSLVARLSLKRADGAWAARLRLYPILSDNLATGYRPRPVSEEDALYVYNTLLARGQRPFQQMFSMGRDGRGFYLERTGG